MRIKLGRAAAAAWAVCLSIVAADVGTASPCLEYRPITAAAPVPTEAVGPTTPQEMEAFVDGFMATQMTQGPVAGAAVAVVKDGALFFAKGYGYADVEKQVAVDPSQTLFRPGSISKLFTWTAVMQLLEQGKLDLDTDVNRYLKDVRIAPTFPEPITLRNLLTHTAGFEDGGLGYLSAASAKDLVPLSVWVARHVPSRVRPPTRDFSSGANASYSNWGADLAGHIVETVAGMPFDDYIEQRIFEPLGMMHSTFREPLPPALAPYVSSGYQYNTGAFERQEFEFMHSDAPDGALSATATDMARFMLAYLQDGALGEGHILTPETVHLMLTRTLSPDPALNGSALGFYETWINGRRIIGHGGDTLYFHSELALMPEAHLGLFVSVNTGGEGARTATELQKAFFKHYFPARLPPVKPPADARERNARYAGTYRTLRRSYDKLDKVTAAFSDIKAVPMADGTLYMRDPTFGKPGRWVEVANGVFRKTDEDLFVAFKDVIGGRATHLVGPFSAIAAERIAWYDTATFHAFLAVVSLLLSITMLVSAIRHLRTDRHGPGALRWARPCLGLAAVLLIGFVVCLALVLTSGLEQLIYEIPSLLYVALTLPLLAIPLVMATVFFTARVWTSRAWGVGARVHYTLAALAAVAFLWVLSYWNLLGYRIG